jgi:mRNA interferase MazF
MVTSSAQAPWPLDWAIRDLQPAGLKRPALVRMKLFSLDGRLLREPIGSLGERDRQGVTEHLKKLIGW